LPSLFDREKHDMDRGRQVNLKNPEFDGEGVSFRFSSTCRRPGMTSTPPR
jgi:hypothetical protein